MAKIKTTRLEIIRCAASMFMERGFSSTAPKAISDALDISAGNLTYYFPTKEHLLAQLVDMLCEFQWRLMEEEAAEGYSSLMAICLELTSMAAACEADSVAKDFFLSSYSNAIPLEIIRKNDKARAKKVFGQYCKDWTDEQFAEAEILVSGIEFATLFTTGESVPLETRIAGALDTILGIYNVPADVRKLKIAKSLAMDYRGLGVRILTEFREYVHNTTEQAIRELFK